MPIGSYALVQYIVDDFWRAQPKVVLDAGIGMGFYGAAIRQWLDSGYAPEFKTELIGIEGFEGYQNPCWDLYDRVYIDNITNCLKQWGGNKKFNYIIFSDVIEHFTHKEGEEIIAGLISILQSGGTLMIGTPAPFCQQGAVYGNELERHKSVWTIGEFIRMAPELNCGYKIFKNGEPDERGHSMILMKYTKI